MRWKIGGPSLSRPFGLCERETERNGESESACVFSARLEISAKAASSDLCPLQLPGPWSRSIYKAPTSNSPSTKHFGVNLSLFMAESSTDLSQLNDTQRSALQTYLAVTNQEHVAAIPLLERSQWNVEVRLFNEDSVVSYNSDKRCRSQ